MSKSKIKISPIILITVGIASLVIFCIGSSVIGVFMTLGDPNSSRSSSTSFSYESSYEEDDPVEVDEPPSASANESEDTRHGLTLTQRKEFYRAWVLAEDSYDRLTGRIDQQKEAEAKAKLLEQYGLTKQQAIEIGVEAFEQNWPLPDVP